MRTGEKNQLTKPGSELQLLLCRGEGERKSPKIDSRRDEMNKKKKYMLKENKSSERRAARMRDAQRKIGGGGEVEEPRLKNGRRRQAG